MHARASVVTTPEYDAVTSGMMMRSSTLAMNASMSSLFSAVLNRISYLKQPTVGLDWSSLPRRMGASGSQVNSSYSSFSAVATSSPLT